MSLRNRATPAKYTTLTDSLSQAAREHPAIARAAANLDRVTSEIIERGEARLAALNDNGTRWREDEPHKMTPAQHWGRPYLQERFAALQCALTQPCVVRFEVPAQLASVGNRKDISIAAMHARRVSVKAKRALGERIARQFRLSIPGHSDPDWEFLVVVLTRIAPRTLDSDNLESSLKAIRDGIATGLGIDDRDACVRYVTSQERGAPRYCAVRAELFIQPKEAT